MTTTTQEPLLPGGGGGPSGPAPGDWRTYLLATHDPATGCATTIVAVAGVAADDTSYVSWMPWRDAGVVRWRQRLAACTEPLHLALDEWAATSDGISSDTIEVPAPPAIDLAGAVEAVIDSLLGTG